MAYYCCHEDKRTHSQTKTYIFASFVPIFLTAPGIFFPDASTGISNMATSSSLANVQNKTPWSQYKQSKTPSCIIK